MNVLPVEQSYVCLMKGSLGIQKLRPALVLSQGGAFVVIGL